jgi:hypothetical protein
MTYGQLHQVFAKKVKHYTPNELDFALQDCHDTLKIHRNLSTDDPYYIKLWAEIDAIRDRKLELSKRCK